MTEFGERLKFFRMNILKIKRKDFCEKYSIPLSSVQSWENYDVEISKRQMDNLVHKLKEDGINFNEGWLFEGKGGPWDALKDANVPENSLAQNLSETDHIYKVDSYSYEPLIKKNAVLTLDPINLREINCPAFAALQDSLRNMHFGMLNLTINKGYVMEAYQGHFYKIIVNDEYRVFLIKSISFYD